MKRFSFALLLFITTIQIVNATLSLNELQRKTQLSLDEINYALTYLAQLEQEGDEAWGVYHHVLPRLINHYKLKRGCEVGVASGTHCKKILATTTVEKLYGIDPYFNYGDPNNAAMKQPWFDIYFERIKDKLSIFGSRFEFIRDFSASAAKRFNDNELDFVFIDGNHLYSYVIQDIRTWYEKVHSGGLIAGDDYTMHDGVKQAVDEFVTEKNLPVNFDKEQPRIWWIVKP